MKTPPLQELVRARLRELTPNRTRLAEFLKVDPSTISKLLSEDGTAITIEWLDSVRAFYQRTPAELLIDPGATIQPVTHLEAAILDIMRKMDQWRQRSLLDVLEWQRSSTLPSRRGKRVNELTSEEAMIVSLYRGMADSDAQAGIVMQMRGFVRAKTEDDTVAPRARK